MKIQDFLSANRIVADLKGQERSAVLRELAMVLAESRPGLDARAVQKVLEDREKLGSTGIGAGVAIPHAKMAGLDEVLLAVGRSSEGIEFDSADGKPAHLFFVIVAPENSVSVHLTLLARINRLAMNDAARNTLLTSGDAAGIMRAIETFDEAA
ncbi:PTS sugar transporter subunit IIA [bacterium]|nr:PTS sugar transporter subunit IIA [bacterium]